MAYARPGSGLGLTSNANGGASQSMPCPAGRITGVDVARGLAILGMFVAHAIPRANEAELVVDGRSSILFATLAGISLGIMTGLERPTESGRRAHRVMSIVARAMILFLLGIALGALDSGIAIILEYYAFMFLLLTPALFLPRWALGLVAAGLAVIAPALAAATDDVSLPVDSLAYFLQYYLLIGSYPALVWLPFLLVGLIAARSGLGRAKTQLWMMVAGVIFSVLGYGAAPVLLGITAAAHSGSTAEVLGSGGVAIAIIGALLWCTSPERTGIGPALRTAFAPISSIGAMALTVYTLQIVSLTVFAALRESTDGVNEYPGWPLLIGMTIVSLLFATLWHRFLGKGPLERLLTSLTR